MIRSIFISLILSLPFAPDVRAQEFDRKELNDKIEEYSREYLSEKIEESTNEQNDDVTNYVMTNDRFITEIRKSLKKSKIDWQGYAKGADLNLKFKNFTIQNLIILAGNDVFLSLRLRKEEDSPIEELQKGIGLLGRFRDNIYVILVLHGPHHQITSSMLLINAYSELYFNKLNANGRVLVWALHNESSFGGDYSSVVLRVRDPKHDFIIMAEVEIFGRHKDMEPPVQVDRMLHYSFSQDTLRVEGKEYIDGKDSTLSQTIKLIHK